MAADGSEGMAVDTFIIIMHYDADPDAVKAGRHGQPVPFESDLGRLLYMAQQTVRRPVNSIYFPDGNRVEEDDMPNVLPESVFFFWDRPSPPTALEPPAGHLFTSDGGTIPSEPAVLRHQSSSRHEALKQVRAGWSPEQEPGSFSVVFHHGPIGIRFNSEMRIVCATDQAAQKGVQPGDVILGVKRVQCSNKDALVDIIKAHGRPFQMHLQRLGSAHATPLRNQPISRLTPPNDLLTNPQQVFRGQSEALARSRMVSSQSAAPINQSMGEESLMSYASYGTLASAVPDNDGFAPPLPPKEDMNDAIAELLRSQSIDDKADARSRSVSSPLLAPPGLLSPASPPVTASNRPASAPQDSNSRPSPPNFPPPRRSSRSRSSSAGNLSHTTPLRPSRSGRSQLTPTISEESESPGVGLHLPSGFSVKVVQIQQAPPSTASSEQDSQQKQATLQSIASGLAGRVQSGGIAGSSKGQGFSISSMMMHKEDLMRSMAGGGQPNEAFLADMLLRAGKDNMEKAFADIQVAYGELKPGEPIPASFDKAWTLAQRLNQEVYAVKGNEILIFNKKKAIDGGDNLEVRGGTLDALVEQLTADDRADPEYTFVFMLTYRSFTDAVVLFQHLRNRFDNCEDVAQGTGKIHPVRLKVASVIKQWLESYFYDFEEDPRLYDHLKSFIEEMTQQSAVQKLGHLLRKTLERRETKKERAVVANEVVLPKPKMTALQRKMSMAISSREIQAEDASSVLNFNMKEVARQLSLMTSATFVKVKAKEFLNKSWEKKNKHELAPNLSALVTHFNSLSY